MDSLMAMDSLVHGGSRSFPGAAATGRVLLGAVVVPALLLTGCSGDAGGAAAGKQVRDADIEAMPTERLDPEPSPAPERTEPTATATVVPPPEFDPAVAFDVVQYLADEIGPREATSDAFHEAAAWVDERFAELGYQVARVEVPVPRGDPSYRPEWGTVVEPGTSANVVADPDGFDPAEPHVVIGAHLDSVGVSPGAEDNASGVAVVLGLARLTAELPAAVPVRFIAFGAEEPRGPGDGMHHFGSQQYVRELSGSERDATIAMVSLDRVGVPAAAVPVCTGGTGTTDVRDALVDAANDAGVDAETCENRASDHWSFEKADIPAARLGSVPYGGYHSPGDRPSVVDPDQLDRVGTVVWQWLQGL
jgi:Peptidase family M28